ncbi:glycosyl hydrolase family 26 [Nocardiopsis sediminis]|uniref:Glycosyl hydrolase family 26 n=1 Tax=Nocardiopsis sediminis TaxID=1778267 RepID=A0ABV8FFC4_9ACTN
MGEQYRARHGEPTEVRGGATSRIAGRRAARRRTIRAAGVLVALAVAVATAVPAVRDAIGEEGAAPAGPEDPEPGSSSPAGAPGDVSSPPAEGGAPEPSGAPEPEPGQGAPHTDAAVGAEESPPGEEETGSSGRPDLAEWLSEWFPGLAPEQEEGQDQEQNEEQEPEPDAGPSGGPASSPSPPDDPAPAGPGSGPGGADCEVSRILEPTCGVWWGASPWQNDPAPLEEAAGRPMDIVYTWHGVDQTNIPNKRERRLAAEGRFIHANIEARAFERSGRPDLDYRDIIAGEYDDALTAQARGIADLGSPMFVTFDHEADAQKRYNRRGTPEEFVGAWRHIVDLYRRNGADNAVFVWNVTGWPGNLDRLPSLWPGNDHVDWISWEAYNMTGCELQPGWDHVASFEEAMAPAYRWIQNEGPKHGIDPGKPVMIGEMGTVPIADDPRATAQWYADIPEALRGYERVRAVKLWDGTTAPTCDFRVLKDEHALRGFAKAGRDPYVNIPDPAREAIADAVKRARRARAEHSGQN